MKRVYLDVCALCRPFDDQSQIRIRMETDAVQLILAHIREGKIQLIISPVHRVEISATANTEERIQLETLLEHLATSVDFDLTHATPGATRRTADLEWYTNAILREGRINMTITRYLPEEELVRRGVEALVKALGPMETTRFLTLTPQRRIDVVQRHRQWQDTLVKEQFFDDVFGDKTSVEE
jgi:hypothetical protein